MNTSMFSHYQWRTNQTIFWSIFFEGDFLGQKHGFGRHRSQD
jgi:hypothetical protein